MNFTIPPRSKGNSLIQFPNDFTIIDVETTGRSPNYDEIIELAAVKIVDGEISNTFSSLVKPNHHVSEFISELTGITNKMLKDAPKIHETLPAYLDFIGNDIVIGHNVNYDINFIYDTAQVLGLTEHFNNDYVDTLRLSRWLLRDLPNHKLDTVAANYSIDRTDRHRSLPDCLCCFHCFMALRSTAIEKHQSIESFIQFINEKKRKKHAAQLSAKNISTDKTEFDISHPLYQQVCVFTGTLARMPRKEAMQLVVDLGGICADGVTKKTNFLILGNNDYCSTIKDGKSSKQKKAESLKLSGQDIEIIPEDIFYDLVSD